MGTLPTLLPPPAKWLMDHWLAIILSMEYGLLQCRDSLVIYVINTSECYESMLKLELCSSRAHTPRALSIFRFLHRDRPVMLTISTSPVVGMVDGRGYDGRQKDAICDIRGPCLTIGSTFKSVCRWFRLIGHIYELLRCLDVEIWRFSWWQQTDGQLLYPCACAQGN